MATNQLDFFEPRFADASPKGELSLLEHPYFSLSTRADHSVLSYRYGDLELEIKPSHSGRATIYDFDMLLYAVGHATANHNVVGHIPDTFSFPGYDYLKFTGRHTGGNYYAAMIESLERLKGTVITVTDHSRGSGRGRTRITSFLQEADTTEDTGNVMVQLPSWLLASIANQKILTLSREYFEIRSQFDRRLYLLSVRHCGDKNQFRIGLDKLYEKFGHKSNFSRFKYELKTRIAKDLSPDFRYEIIEDRTLLIERKRPPLTRG